MRPYIIAAAVLAATVFAGPLSAQTDRSVPSPYPHPTVEASLDLNGDGYTPVSFDLHPGIDWETIDWTFAGVADYSMSGKVGAGPGHSRSMGGDLGYKVTGYWTVLTGATWAKTYTQQYDKTVSNWRAGLGRDWFHGDRFSGRLSGEYSRQFNERTSYPSQAGCANCGNNLSGVIMDLWMPSPYTHHHWFYHERLGLNWFQPSEVPGVTSQRWTVSGGASFAVVYRF